MLSKIAKCPRVRYLREILLPALLLVAIAPAFAADCAWQGNVANWNEPSEWSCNQVPGPGDTASQINGTITVTEETTVDSFLMQGGVLTGDADLEVVLSMTWTGGTQAGVGKTHIPESATLLIASGGVNVKGLSRTLENAGDATVSHVVNDGGGVLTNLSTGTLYFTADLSFPSVTNAGVLTKSAGAGITFVNGLIQTTTGSTNVDTGTLSLQGSTTIEGSMMATGTTIRMESGGPYDVLGTASITASNLFTSNNTVNIAIGGADFSVDNMTIVGGTVTFDGPTVSLPSLTLSTGGVLTGSADFEVSGAMAWSGGAVGGTGKLTISEGATLSIAAGSSKGLNRTLDNAGVTTMTDTMSSGAETFMNLSTGTLNFAGDVSFNAPLSNAGMLTKSAGAGSTFIGPSFTQTEIGTTDVQTGTLILQGTCAVDGILTASSTSLQMDNGGPYMFGGAELDVGNLSMNNATVDLSGADSITMGNFYQNGGSVNLDHPLVMINGNFTRTAAGSTFLAGTGKVVFGGGTTQNLSVSRLTEFNFVEVKAGTRLIEVVEADNASVGFVLWNRGVIEKTKPVPVSGTVRFGLTGVELDVIAPGTFTFLQVERIGGNHPNAEPGTYSEQHWTMTPTGGGFEVDLTLDHCYQPEGDVRLCRYTGSTWDCAADAATITTITRLGVSELFDWTLGFEAPGAFRTSMECGNPSAWSNFIWN